MSYNICLNDIQQNDNNIVLLAGIDNYSQVMKRVTIGESIRSKPFELHFDSVGRSLWTLLLFLKGQYIRNDESVIVDSGQVSLYLQMVECENTNNTLNLTINGAIKSPYCDMPNLTSQIKHADFSYNKITERWTGPIHSCSSETLNSQENKIYFFNDSLTVECSLEQKSNEKNLKRKSPEDAENHIEAKKRMKANRSMITIMPLLNEYKGINELHGKEPCYLPPS